MQNLVQNINIYANPYMSASDSDDPRHEYLPMLLSSPVNWTRPTNSNGLNAHSTDTAVLGLPSEEIQQRPQRLSNQTETHPEDAVANRFAVGPTHFLQRCCEGDEGQLEHHAEESNA